jgi:hypothetical protein
MRCDSKPYLSTTLAMTPWKGAALAMLFSLAAGPALASNGTAAASAGAANLAGGTAALDQGAVDIRQLSERVVGLEQKVDQLGAAATPPAPTAAELKRTTQEEERQAEFQRQVWTMP